jgi:hypothetical protein
MIKRISVRFNTDFKEDKELLETLEKKRNQNGYIKMALKNFVSGTNLDPFLAESIADIVRETLKTELQGKMKEMIETTIEECLGDASQFLQREKTDLNEEREDFPEETETEEEAFLEEEPEMDPADKIDMDLLADMML